MQSLTSQFENVIRDVVVIMGQAERSSTDRRGGIYCYVRRRIYIREEVHCERASAVEKTYMVSEDDDMRGYETK
jgi:hypothetical protein